MTPMTTCFTTYEGILHAHINEHSVTIELTHDTGEVVTITIPTSKFEYIAKDFNEAHTC